MELSREDKIKEIERLRKIAEIKSLRDQKESAPEEDANDPSLAQKVETGVRSGLEGMTFGATEPLISGANAAIQTIGNKFIDPESKIDLDTLKKEYASDVSNRRNLEKALPKTALTGEVVGAVLPALATGGAGALGSVGKLAARGGEAIAESGAKKLLGKAGAKILGKAAEGALYSGASEAVKSGFERPTGFIEEGEGPTLGEAAKSGAIMSGALATVPYIGKGLAAGGKKVLSSFGGVSEGNINKYLDRIKAGPLEELTPQEIADRVGDASQKAKEVLVQKRDEFAKGAVSAVDALEKRVNAESGKAYDILGKTKGEVDKRFISGLFQDAIDNSGGISESSNKARKALETLNARVDQQYGDKLSFPDLKKIIQDLDADSKAAYSMKAGEFGEATGNSLKSVRKGIDDLLKESVPEYKAQMGKVSSIASNLEDLSSKFGDEASAQKTLDQLKLSKITGKGTEANKSFQNLVQMSGNNAFENHPAIVSELEKAANIQDPNQFVKNIFSNSGATQRNKDALKMLATLDDNNLMKSVNDARMVDNFYKNNTNGSRNVNLFSMIFGGIVGGLTGGFGPALLGIGSGAGIGAVMDKHGPQVTRKLLDGIGKIQGMPTMKKLEVALSQVPPDVQEQVKQDFIRAIATGGAPGPVEISPEDALTLQNDVKNSKLTNIDKAKMLKQYNDNSTVDADLLKKVMLDGQQPQKDNEASNFLKQQQTGGY